jgi:DNA adenine methylase
LGNEALKRDETDRIRPFVKWAGGKGQLIPELITRLPKTFNRYFEPFLGGGALFFALQPPKAYLSDTNQELITTYRAVRDSVESLIKALSKHKHEEEYFYAVRRADTERGFAQWGEVRRASRFIFLNRTCFNGLYRVNLRGEFNVPFGRYTNPSICNAPLLMRCSKALQGAQIDTLCFSEISRRTRKGDFVYFDPPYAPLNPTSNFTSYSKDGFSTDMQIALRDVCRVLSRKGVNFMLSNSSAPLVFDLYKEFKIERVKASRLINSKATKRGQIDEVIVRNY